MDEYLSNKLRRDYEDDQLYAMSRECTRCGKLCPPDELQAVYNNDDQEWCKDCMELAEVQADLIYEQQREEEAGWITG